MEDNEKHKFPRILTSILILLFSTFPYFFINAKIARIEKTNNKYRQADY